jgi:hypothetical protein
MTELTRDQQIDQEIQNGEAISRLLNDNVVVRVFNDLEKRYIRQWKDAATPENREVLWAKVGALGELQAVLEGTVQSGLHARALKDRREREETQT